jgi:hypothetical protein
VDSTTYAAFTGKTVNTSQTARFTMQQKVAKRWLQRVLGYPLCPDDWDNQYIEKGKTDGDFFFIDDQTQLQPPDDVVNSYRFFQWTPDDPFIAIDPATAIHAVKLVENDVTIWTFDPTRFMPQWENYGDEPFAKFLAIRKPIAELFLFNGFVFDWMYYWNFYLRQQKGFRLAIDADWAFEELPLELKQTWADMIVYNMDDKRNISQEAIGSREHMYTKFSPDIDDPLKRHAAVIERYAGPNRPGGDPGVL